MWWPSGGAILWGPFFNEPYMPYNTCADFYAQQVNDSAHVNIETGNL